MPHSDVSSVEEEAPGSSPGQGAPAAAWKINELNWLPIVDAYRTICIAPSPEVRAVFENIGEISGIATTKEKLTQELSKVKVTLPQICGGPTPEDQIVINEQKCISCGWCERACFHLAIEMDGELPRIDDKLCEVCGMCLAVCPMGALSIAPRS